MLAQGSLLLDWLELTSLVGTVIALSVSMFLQFWSGSIVISKNYIVCPGVRKVLFKTLRDTEVQFTVVQTPGLLILQVRLELIFGFKDSCTSASKCVCRHTPQVVCVKCGRNKNKKWCVSIDLIQPVDAVGPPRRLAA